MEARNTSPIIDKKIFERNEVAENFIEYFFCQIYIIPYNIWDLYYSNDLYYDLFFNLIIAIFNSCPNSKIKALSHIINRIIKKAPIEP